MKSLFLRIFLWFCGASLIIVCVIGAGFIATTPGLLATSWQRVGRGAIVSAARIAVESYERGGQAEVDRYFRTLAHDTGMSAGLFDPSGRELSGNGWLPPREILDALQARSEGDLDVFPFRGLAGLSIRGPSGTPYVFAATVPPRERGALWSRVLVISFVATSGLLCFLLARHLTSPVVHLRTLTSRFSQGDLTARITQPALLQRRDEIGGLARDFNRMAARIQTLLKAQTRLIADVSHELRSPLTRLSLALGLIRRGGDSVSRTSLTRMEREVERLNTMIGQLLTLSRLECLDQPPPMESLDLAGLVCEIAADADFEATQVDRGVRLTECPPCSIHGARDLLRSAIENVVRNALRYTAPATQVLLRLEYSPGHATAAVIVDDQGPGVPPAELAHVFEPFYRVDASRERQSGGAGLGLAIARQVVALHAGSITASNREEGGLEVRILLPAGEGAAPTDPKPPRR